MTLLLSNFRNDATADDKACYDHIKIKIIHTHCLDVEKCLILDRVNNLYLEEMYETFNFSTRFTIDAAMLIK